MGRTPKPEALHIIEGTYRSDRHGKKQNFKVVKLSPPSTYSGEKKRLWRNIAEVLSGEMQVLTKIDKYSLMMLVDKLYEYVKLQKYINRFGTTFKFTNRDGETYDRIRPQVKLRDRAWADFVKLAGEFGMSPAARMRVRVQSISADDEIDRRRRKDWL
jgi:P27 family predicted phage terminase small subunit